MPDIIDYSEECDYNALKNSIKQILLKYYETHDDGSASEAFDPSYDAETALYEIHNLVGDI